MRAWLRKIQRQLFSGKQYLQTENEVSITETPGRSGKWVICRSLCHFTRLDLSSVPSGKRGAALENRITLLSPYKKPGYWVMWEAGIAALWIWDEGVRTEHLQALSAKGEDCSTLEALPESAFSAQQEKGNFIYEGLSGFIGQYWSDQALVHESYWPQYPTRVEWHQFLRGSGQRTSEPPEAAAIAFEGIPWRIGQITAKDVRAVEIKTAFTVITLFLILLSYQVTGTLRLAISNLMLKSSIAEAEASIAPTVALRDRVFEIHNSNVLLSELASDMQTRDMLLVAKLLPPGSNITEWHFQSGQLEIIVQDPTQDLESYVRALESAAQFSHVTLEPLPRRQQLRITMQVVNV